MNLSLPDPERSEPTADAITDASPISVVLDALLTARELAWAARGEPLSPYTADKLLNELDCAIEELVDSHQRSSRATAWLLHQLASPR